MTNLASEAIIMQIDATVRGIMNNVVIPSIKDEVKRNIDDAVFRAIRHYYASVIEERATKVVKEMLEDKIHVTVTVDP